MVIVIQLQDKLFLRPEVALLIPGPVSGWQMLIIRMLAILIHLLRWPVCRTAAIFDPMGHPHVHQLRLSHVKFTTESSRGVRHPLDSLVLDKLLEGSQAKALSPPVGDEQSRAVTCIFMECMTVDFVLAIA